MRRNPVAWLALFFALTGTGLAAGRAITGDDVRNGSLTRADFGRHALRAVDVPHRFRGPRGQLGPAGPSGPYGARKAPPGPTFPGATATVDASGKVVEGDAITVTHPATGVYCLSGASQFLLAQSARIGDPQIVTADKVTGDPCPSNSGARVSVFDGDGTPADGAFFVIIT